MRDDPVKGKYALKQNVWKNRGPINSYRFGALIQIQVSTSEVTARCMCSGTEEKNMQCEGEDMKMWHWESK